MAPPDLSQYSLQMNIELRKSLRKSAIKDCMGISDQINISSQLWDEFLEDIWYFDKLYLSSTYDSFDIYNLKLEQSLPHGSYKLTHYMANRGSAYEYITNPVSCLHEVYFKQAKALLDCIPISKDTLQKPISALCATCFLNLCRKMETLSSHSSWLSS